MKRCEKDKAGKARPEVTWGRLLVQDSTSREQTVQSQEVFLVCVCFIELRIKPQGFISIWLNCLPQSYIPSLRTVLFENRERLVISLVQHFQLLSWTTAEFSSLCLGLTQEPPNCVFYTALLFFLSLPSLIPDGLSQDQQPQTSEGELSSNLTQIDPSSLPGSAGTSLRSQYAGGRGRLISESQRPACSTE